MAQDTGKTAAIRDVWVPSRSRHVPAHRIPGATATDQADTSVCVIACPPYIATGGTAITRREAQQLRVFPCRECFSIPHPDLHPPRRQP
jgi:hypothetical protein